MNLEIKTAYKDLESIKLLFTEYAQSLEVDLCFQDFNNELTLLPGKYVQPDGRLYVAYWNNHCAGCIALRRFDNKRAELKRLYIRNEFRGYGISKQLIQRIIQDAQEIGYQSIVLDTLSTMNRAINLYKSFGFKEVEPYYNNPLEGAVYFELDLTQRKEILCGEKIVK